VVPQGGGTSNATAQNRLGDCYTNGTGVEKDKAEAVNGIARQQNKVLL